MKKVELKVENPENDNTLLLRSVLENTEIKHVVFPENMRIFAKGMVDGEPYQNHRTLFGYGVMRLQQRNGVLIDGNNSTVYNNDAAIPYPQRGVEYSSFRANLKIYESKNIIVRNLVLESGNKNSEYHHVVEFEHGIHTDECQNILLENIKTVGSFGCGIYIGGKSGQKNIYVLNPELTSTGRMGLSVSQCENLYIKNMIADSARGPFDVEPPTDSYINKNIVLDGGEIRSNGGFYAFPMGGNGTIENLLIQNVIYHTAGATAYVVGGKDTSVRKNIIYSGNKAPETKFGSSKAAYVVKAQNVLIEKEERKLDSGRSRIAVQLSSTCENVWIRNNKWENGDYIKVAKGYDLSKIKQYGNSIPLTVLEYEDEKISPSQIKKGEKYEILQPSGFEYSEVGAHPVSANKYYKNMVFTATKDGYESENNEGELYRIISTTQLPEYVPTKEEDETIPFEVDEWVLSAYENRFVIPTDEEILNTASEPELPPVEPEPTEPEPPTEEEPEPTPPIEEEPTPEQPEVTEEEAFNAFKTFLRFIKK